MARAHRRQFLVRVGQGMFVAGLGSQVALDLQLAPAVAADEVKERINFGALESLAALMQDTPVDKLLPTLNDQLKRGTPLKSLVAAGALANARTFGGEDYVGFHSFMALAPAYHMSQQMPEGRKALPVFKVLYRNTNRMQEQGGSEHEVLGPIKADHPQSVTATAALRKAVHDKDLTAAERALCRAAGRSPADAWDAMLAIAQEAPEVHRIVLAQRAWEMLDVVGVEYADVMLRQSVHYCVRNEDSRVKYHSEVGSLLPKLLDEHKLTRPTLGSRSVDDGWLERQSAALFAASPEEAAGMTAAALAEGIAPEDIAESISMAAIQLVLRDAGRPADQVRPGKPQGSVHGDSIGVHACDSMNAWRRIARDGNPRHQVSSLILASYQMARDRGDRGGNFLEWKPRPYDEELQAIRGDSPDDLLKQLDGAIREQNQALACTLTHVYGQRGYSAEPVFALLLKYATSEDGALHAEKFYRTASDEFTATRPAFRWRNVTALARVTASEFGEPAPGYAQACELIGVPA